MTGDGPAAAVAALSAALGADPGRGDLWSELATALVAAGRAREGWDAAVRGVQLAPQSASSHRAVGTVAAALNDARQAESAYRHALLLDPSDHETQTALSRLPRPAPGYADPPAAAGRRRAPDPPENPPSGRRRAPDPDHRAPDPDPLLDSPPSGRRRAPEPDPRLDPLPSGRSRASEPGQPAIGRRRAPEPDPLRDSLPSGRRRAPEPDPLPTGRRRAPDPDQQFAPPTQGGRRRAPEPPAPTAAPPLTTTAVGPAWPAPAPYDPLTPAQPVPTGATRVVPTSDGWRPALIAVVRIEWLLTVACYVGLAFARVAPYTAGALAGLAVALGGYGRLRWQSARTRRPPPRDRPATALAIAAAVATIVVVPAAMFGALTAARAAAIAAVTCATVAAVLLRRTPGS